MAAKFVQKEMGLVLRITDRARKELLFGTEVELTARIEALAAKLWHSFVTVDRRPDLRATEWLIRGQVHRKERGPRSGPRRRRRK